MLWNPSPHQPSRPAIPVSVLSGFLGAGKTTVLNHILAEQKKQKIAVIVNDLGAINIDAALIKNAFKANDAAIDHILELQDGCICCSIQSDLLDALLQLSQELQPDHILIEATGVAEPKEILKSLQARNFFGRRATEFVVPANMLTVMDAGSLDLYFKSPENIGHERRTRLLQNDKRRPIQELLIEQIECADILLINKTDTVDASSLAACQRYLYSLNPSAEIWKSCHGTIDVPLLMNQARYSADQTLSGAQWQKSIQNNQAGRIQSLKFLAPTPSNNTNHSSQGLVSNAPASTVKNPNSPLIEQPVGALSQHKDYGLDTYIFNARQPFIETRFLEVMRSGLPGVIRCKGFYWTDRQPDRVGLLSIAGKQMRADYLAKWWIDQIESGEASYQQVPEMIKKSWLPQYGDRRQELIFIGIDLAANTIEKLLTECFVNEVSEPF